MRIPWNNETSAGFAGQALGWALASHCFSQVEKLAAGYRGLSDESVVAACRRLIEAPKLAPAEDGGAGYSMRRFTGRRLTTRDAEAIAIGCEAFTRFPPDGIPVGTRLYPEQVQAAIHLTRGSLVQMDTGEGKTFALMLAAFALLRLHPKVYIVTANPYLVRRDAAATAPFWAEIGVSVGIALPDYYNVTGWPHWDATVIYTTASNLIFTCMSDDMLGARTDRRIKRGALLVDEVDAILLDELTGRFEIVRNVAADPKDWQPAIGTALSLSESHIRRDVFSRELRAFLTPAGLAEVGQQAGGIVGSAERLRLYRDVELAYTGIREAVEGRDYYVIDDAVVPVDAASGWRTLNRIPDWVAPLASYRGLSGSYMSQSQHLADGVAVLLRFSHLAGASGTVVHEAVGYLFRLGLAVVAIPPRHPRYRGGRQPDRFFSSFDNVTSYLRDEVAEEAEKRPVLVVTTSRDSAYRLAGILRESVPAGVDVTYAVGDTFAEQQLFERAGRAGVVIVSTREAGRGVDIQLDETARQNGGSLLILIGHALYARLDRQLLGRVGRQGDAYTAYFCNHPADGMTGRILASGAVIRISAGDSYTESRTLEHQITRIQRVIRRLDLQSFTGAAAKSQADAEVFEMLRQWLLLLQEASDYDGFTPDFALHAAHTYLTYHVPGLDGRQVSTLSAQQAAAKVAALCGQPGLTAALEVRLEGQSPEKAREVLVSALAEEIQRAVAENLRLRPDWITNMTANRALLWLSVLRRRAGALANGHHNRVPLGEGSRPAALPSSGPIALEEDRPAVPDESRPIGTYERTAPAPQPEHVDTPGRMLARMKPMRSLIRAAVSARPAIAEDLDRISFSADDDGQGVKSLTLATFSLRVGDPAVTDEQLAALDRAIGRAEEYYRAIAARPKVYGDRTPVQIVKETIYLVSETAAASQDRLEWGLKQQQLQNSRYQHAYLAGMQDLRKVCDAAIAEQVCRNLIAGADPTALDDLFAARDHAVLVGSPQLSLGWDSLAPAITRSPDQKVASRREELIQYFAAGLREDGWRRPPRREDLMPALNMVLAESHPALLSTSAGVAEALERWRKSPERKDLPPVRRRRVDRAVRQFFAYLHEQGHAARLPRGAGERTRPLRNRIADRMRAPGMQVAALMLVALLALGAALALVPIHPAVYLTGAPRLADLWLTAGLFSAGAAAGPVLMALCGAAFVRWLAFGPEADAGVYPLERLLLAVVAAGTAAYLMLAGERFSVHALIAAAGLTITALIMASLAWNLENIGRIKVTAGFIAVSTAAVLLPALTQDHPGLLVLPLAAVGAVLAVVWRIVPVRLPVNSLQWAGDSAVAGEVVSSTRTLKAHAGWTAHGCALAAALLVGAATGAVLWVAPAVYAVVYLLWTAQLARSVTSVPRWAEQLRRVDQEYASIPARPDLAAGLATARRKLILRETAVGAVLIAAAVTFGGTGRLFGGPVVHLGLLAVVVGFVGAELAITAATSVLEIGSFERSGSNLNADGLSETLLSDVRSTMERFARRLALFTALYLALAKLAELIHVYELIKSIGDEVRKVLGG